MSLGLAGMPKKPCWIVISRFQENSFEAPASACQYGASVRGMWWEQHRLGRWSRPHELQIPELWRCRHWNVSDQRVYYPC